MLNWNRGVHCGGLVLRLPLARLRSSGIDVSERRVRCKLSRLSLTFNKRLGDVKSPDRERVTACPLSCDLTAGFCFQSRV